MEVEGVESPSKTYIGRYERAFATRQLTVVFIPVVAYLSRLHVSSWREFFLLALIAGVSNLIYYVLTVRGKFLPSLKWVQITIDVVLWTALIRITGTTDSMFYLGYPLEILVSAIALSVQGCIYGAFLSGTLYTALFFTSGAQSIQSDLLPKLLFLAAICWLCVYLIKKFLAINEKVSRLNKQLESKVEASNEELKNILSSMTSGLVAVDGEGKIIEFNRAAEGIFAVEREQVMGKTVHSVLPSGSKIESVFSDIVSSAQGSKRVYELELDNGKTRKKLEIRPYALRAEHSAKAAALVNDITEMERMKEKIIQDKALKTLGVMVASIAHDLRNPLSAMRGFVRYLRPVVGEGSDEGKGIIENLEQGILSMEKTLQDLLLFSNKPKLKKRTVDLRQVAGSALSFLPEKAGRLAISKNFAGNPILVRGDPELLRRCVLNLLLNAVDATPPGGEIRVSVGSSNGSAFLSVANDGAGVSRAMRGRIFEPFYTTKEKGTGLGLAIVRNLVELHKGFISLESEEGKGAEFKIMLPAYSASNGDSEGDYIMRATQKLNS